MSAPLLCVAEIERRLPIWTALSDTFLDTELPEDAYREIAKVILAAGFSDQEALTIYKNDVAPAFYGNLLGVVGEWEGWPEANVRERVLKARRSTYDRVLSWLLHRRYVEKEWAKIRVFF